MLDNIGDKTFRVCSFATSRDMGLMIKLPERVGVDKVGADDDGWADLRCKANMRNVGIVAAWIC